MHEHVFLMENIGINKYFYYVAIAEKTYKVGVVYEGLSKFTWPFLITFDYITRFQSN